MFVSNVCRKPDSYSPKQNLDSLFKSNETRQLSNTNSTLDTHFKQGTKTSALSVSVQENSKRDAALSETALTVLSGIPESQTLKNNINPLIEIKSRRQEAPYLRFDQLLTQSMLQIIPKSVSNYWKEERRAFPLWNQNLCIKPDPASLQSEPMRSLYFFHNQVATRHSLLTLIGDESPSSSWSFFLKEFDAFMSDVLSLGSITEAKQENLLAHYKKHLSIRLKLIFCIAIVFEGTSQNYHRTKTEYNIGATAAGKQALHHSCSAGLQACDFGNWLQKDVKELQLTRLAAELISLSDPRARESCGSSTMNLSRFLRLLSKGIKFDKDFHFYEAALENTEKLRLISTSSLLFILQNATYLSDAQLNNLDGVVEDEIRKDMSSEDPTTEFSKLCHSQSTGNTVRTQYLNFVQKTLVESTEKSAQAFLKNIEWMQRVALPFCHQEIQKYKKLLSDLEELNKLRSSIIEENSFEPLSESKEEVKLRGFLVEFNRRAFDLSTEAEEDVSSLCIPVSFDKNTPSLEASSTTSDSNPEQKLHPAFKIALAIISKQALVSDRITQLKEELLSSQQPDYFKALIDIKQRQLNFLAESLTEIQASKVLKTCKKKLDESFFQAIKRLSSPYSQNHSFFQKMTKDAKSFLLKDGKNLTSSARFSEAQKKAEAIKPAMEKISIKSFLTSDASYLIERIKECISFLEEDCLACILKDMSYKTFYEEITTDLDNNLSDEIVPLVRTFDLLTPNRQAYFRSFLTADILPNLENLTSGEQEFEIS